MPAPFVTTPMDVIDRMLDLARADHSTRVYDLGCGDGRIVIRAAERFGCAAVGIENGRERAEVARMNVCIAGLEDRVRIVTQDMFEADISHADVVMLYLLPFVNVKLLPQLQTLQPGARVISHDFDLDGVPADHIEDFTSGEDDYTRQLHKWTAPIVRSNDTFA